MTATSKRALIYVRVSRDETGEGASIERQEKACRSLAAARGWTVVDVVPDNSISAYSGKKRPGWASVLQEIESGTVDLVIAWHMDRIARSMLDLEALIALAERHNVGIATATGDMDLSNDQGRMVARILAAVARGEVERKSARQKLANRQRAAQGKSWHSGWRSFGYTLDGQVKAEEAAAFRLAFDDVLNERASMREIARRWTSQGFSGRNYIESANGWTARGVRAAMVNPRYAGIVTYLGEEVADGDWEPLVTKEAHIQMKALVNDPKRRTNAGRGGRTPQHLLTSIAVCSKCGATVHAGNRLGVPSYRCSGRDCLSTPREEADRYVLDGIALALRTLGPSLLVKPDGEVSETLALNEIDSLNGRLDSLSRAFADDAITIDQLTTASSPLRSRIAELEGAAPSPTRVNLRRLSEGAEAAIKEISEMSLARRRRLISELTTITLKPRGRGRRGVPIADQVEVWIRAGDEQVSLAGLIEMAGR